MSATLIDDWLDDEVDTEKLSQLEEWLRDDPDHLQGFFDAVRLQEELRLHYGNTPASVTIPTNKNKGIRIVAALSVAAALVVAALLLIPRDPDRRPTADPLVRVLAGNPQVQMTRIEPGPNPVVIPREQWLVETQVTTLDKPGSLAWSDDCVIDADAGTTLALRSAPVDDPQTEPRSIRLIDGGLTVHLEQSATPVDVLLEESRIRATQATVFTLKDSGPQPFGREVVLSVARGSVELLLPGAENRSVAAGQRVSIP